jgi:heme/copper-type cytochrome/quinol oxidase subunit 1
MSYQLDTTIHNTQWITGHFHLIFAGAIVIMYFAIAYDLWPQLTGRAFANVSLIRLQLWLWFIGIIVLTIPWHWVGILGMPRRMAYFDYAGPGACAPSVFGHHFGAGRFHCSGFRRAVPCGSGPRTSGAARGNGVVPVCPCRPSAYSRPCGAQ